MIDDVNAETIPCKICTEPTTFTGTKLCDRCYHASKQYYNYPIIMGRPITREEIIEGIKTLYNDACLAERTKDSSFVGRPDMVTVINYIDKYGLPANEQMKVE